MKINIKKVKPKLVRPSWNWKTVAHKFMSEVNFHVEPDTNDFRGCCGATILFDFNHEETISEDLRDELESYLEEQSLGHVTDFQEYYDTHADPYFPTQKEMLDFVLSYKIILDLPMLSEGHLYTCILNCDQLHIEEALKERGFRLVSDSVRNSNTGNKLYMYVYEGKSKPVKKPTLVRKSKFGRTRV